MIFVTDDFVNAILAFIYSSLASFSMDVFSVYYPIVPFSIIRNISGNRQYISFESKCFDISFYVKVSKIDEKFKDNFSSFFSDSNKVSNYGNLLKHILGKYLSLSSKVNSNLFFYLWLAGSILSCDKIRYFALPFLIDDDLAFYIYSKAYLGDDIFSFYFPVVRICNEWSLLCNEEFPYNNVEQVLSINDYPLVIIDISFPSCKDKRNYFLIGDPNFCSWAIYPFCFPFPSEIEDFDVILAIPNAKYLPILFNKI